MADYKLIEGLFIYPTPTGAYYAVASKENDKTRQFLRALFRRKHTPVLSIGQLMALMALDEPQKGLELLHHCQKLGFIQGLEQAIDAPTGALEQILPDLLAPLSENGKVLLADNQGFYLASHGFAHEVAEELSALGAEIATIHERRAGLLMNNLGLSSSAWAVVDAKGHSKIGFWPLYIGNTRFVLVISGIPHFNQPEMVSLCWSLSSRYAG
ncbi:MAG: hypothetical protein CVV13_02785 [Gammaproteobacteria bacterium HGW-Gammaproteobacteria-3]|nr:MAG: hypothetical protein CVV13_02785 [Gammaproteobacteria bacterium HGW-Gammaproteobacteria-3]